MRNSRSGESGEKRRGENDEGDTMWPWWEVKGRKRQAETTFLHLSMFQSRKDKEKVLKPSQERREEIVTDEEMEIWFLAIKQAHCLCISIIIFLLLSILIPSYITKQGQRLRGVSMRIKSLLVIQELRKHAFIIIQEAADPAAESNYGRF